MFTKLDRTKYPPSSKPLMAWDGNCGFCHYWIIRWKTFTGDNVEYKPYSQAAPQFPDIDLKYFRQAVRFIDVDGKIYTGPAAAYRSFQYGKRWKWLMPLYEKCKPVEVVSDQCYSFISKRRPFMYKVTVALWGKNPYRQKNYWAYYLGTFGLLAAAVLFSRQ
ncbi:MAG: DCC1-like thiol-disulfide oxidoreductase family protein [Bacteroidales bacterium]